jgi:hypothetical protein
MERMRIGFTCALVSFCFYIIVQTPHDHQAREFAFWSVGFLMSYWLQVDIGNPPRKKRT